ncbi:MAG: hypothetical protein HXS48_01750 [Theionarchaea archaeon]|nr:hypothetical protein [Theionarchaea archaeon]
MYKERVFDTRKGDDTRRVKSRDIATVQSNLEVAKEFNLQYWYCFTCV